VRYRPQDTAALPALSSKKPVSERCGTMPDELSALFERECAPVAQWIRAADFGLSRPMRCSVSVGGQAKRASYLLSSVVVSMIGSSSTMTATVDPVGSVRGNAAASIGHCPREALTWSPYRSCLRCLLVVLRDRG
jgi:hypothetical protein